MVSNENLDIDGLADLIERIRKSDPNFGAIPEDFGWVGDGRKSDAKALRDYKAYISALSAPPPTGAVH